jgi:hypothetical protein
VALSPNLHEREIAQAPILMGGQYKVVTRINDVVYRIQRNLRPRLMVVHLDRFAPEQGTARDERSYGVSSWRVNTVRTEPGGRKARPSTNDTSTDLGRDKMAVRLGRIALRRERCRRVEPLLYNDREMGGYTRTFSR